jgi:hypothetical protein
VVKFYGSSFWNFTGTFFKKYFNGYRDYVNMIPQQNYFNYKLMLNSIYVFTDPVWVTEKCFD